MTEREEIEAAVNRFRSAELLLEEARLVGAPPDCVAERERDLAAAKVRLIELGVDPELPESRGQHP
ncbi:MAG: hypothetical protein IT334_04840 [Thermomicrobiales bacterium]|nr:hypothetical protein [Thermomicrobiales bacterium]